MKGENVMKNIINNSYDVGEIFSEVIISLSEEKGVVIPVEEIEKLPLDSFSIKVDINSKNATREILAQLKWQELDCANFNVLLVNLLSKKEPVDLDAEILTIMGSGDEVYDSQPEYGIFYVISEDIERLANDINPDGLSVIINGILKSDYSLAEKKAMLLYFKASYLMLLSEKKQEKQLTHYLKTNHKASLL